MYRFLKIIQDAAVVIVAVIPFTLKADLSSAPAGVQIFVPFLKYLQGQAWWIGLVSGGTFVLLKIIFHFMTPPWRKQTISEILDHARGYLLRGDLVLNDPAHHHRITLFKYSNFHLVPKPIRGLWPWGRNNGVRWPNSGWLIPIARSGHTTQRVKSSFLAPDDADSAEGIAGKAWAHNRIIPLNDLPAINSKSSASDVSDYANRSWVSPKWVQAKLKDSKPLCRSLCGIPISVKRSLWGVVVVDSTRPDAIVDPQKVTNEVVQLELILATILTRR